MGKDDEKCLKKTNVLVYQQPTGEKKDRKLVDDSCRHYKPPICTPKPKQIRVCTGADMKRMCPPQPCVCAKPKKSRGGFGLAQIAKFGAKAALAAAAVYVSYDMGIWGTVDDTEDICRNVCTILGVPNIRSSHKWDHPACEAEADLFVPIDPDPFAHCKKPPINFERATLNMKECWNKAVNCFFLGLVNFPNITACRHPQKKEEVEEVFEEVKVCKPISNEEQQEIQNQYK